MEQIYAAQKNVLFADDFIRQYLPFIKSETASFLNHVSLEGLDDELGIAMLAFYEAMMDYRKEKGNFISFATTSIRNRLIDYYRKEKKHKGIVSLDHSIDEKQSSQCLLDLLEVSENAYDKLIERATTKKEMETFSIQLATFGLSLTDVSENCPRQERTLTACMKALAFAKENSAIMEELLHNKKLPLRQLADGAGISRKTLERHRKYMIAIMLAYTNGYEIIRGHLYQIRKKEVPAQ